MNGILAATGGDAALVFIEIGAVAIALAVMARIASHLGIPAIPFYLVAGLAVGEGGLLTLSVSEDFIELAGDIGVLLLLLTLGLEYTGDELRRGLRTDAVPGLVDAGLNFTPGFLVGLALGWDATSAVLLGGVTWISSSGVVAKVLTDLDRLGYRETPSILNLLVIEDLAMAVYLPVVAALIARQDVSATALSVVVALLAVAVIIWMAIRWGGRLSALLAPGSDEAVLLAVFGITLLVAGVAEQLQVSAAIGAFLVGLALSGTVQARAVELIRPLRDLFAATFFLFFSFQISPSQLGAVLVPAVALAIITAGAKMVTGWFGAGRHGAAARGRLRAGTALIARGEFSIVIAAVGAGAAMGDDLGALAAAYVLLTAVVGPLAAKYIDSIPLSRRPRSPAPATAADRAARPGRS